MGCRRTKDVFTMALNVHKEIQRRDISVGKNIGNRILRILDRMRPQANIWGPPTQITKEALKSEQVQEGSKSRGGECSKDPTKTSLNASTSTAKSKPVNALYRAGLGGQHGHSIGSGLSSGLSRLALQTSRQSLPLVMGLWWQPVRKNMEFLGERVSSPQLRLLELGSKGSIASSHGLRLGRGVFWADIATWMQKPHHMRGSFGQPTFALLAHPNCCW